MLLELYTAFGCTKVLLDKSVKQCVWSKLPSLSHNEERKIFLTKWYSEQLHLLLLGFLRGQINLVFVLRLFMSILQNVFERY